MVQQRHSVYLSSPSRYNNSNTTNNIKNNNDNNNKLNVTKSCSRPVSPTSMW